MEDNLHWSTLVRKYEDRVQKILWRNDPESYHKSLFYRTADICNEVSPIIPTQHNLKLEMSASVIQINNISENSSMNRLPQLNDYLIKY